MLSPEHLQLYDRDGIVVMPNLFEPAEVEALRQAFERDTLVRGEHRIAESDGDVRAVYASHQRQPEYSALIRTSRLLGTAQQVLGSDVYLYQFKVNAKAAFGGDSWAWHQDYIAWRIADNIPGPALINFALFLDDVTEFNGPVIFLPGSHRDGIVRSDRAEQSRSAQHLDPDDIALSPGAVTALVEQHGLVSPKGPAGTVVAFHPGVVHGSAVNVSPFPRRVAIATYNATTNVPKPVGERRPGYLVSWDSSPLTIDDSLLATAST